MTAVVAVRDKRGTWIAADRAYSGDADVVIGSTSKLVRTRSGWLGYAGDVASGQRFAAYLSEHMTDDPTRSVRAAVDALGRIEDVAALYVDGSAIWYLDAAGVALRLRETSSAIGSGGHAALAAVRALGEYAELEPTARLRRALRYAAGIDPSTAPPFDVRHVARP